MPKKILHYKVVGNNISSANNTHKFHQHKHICTQLDQDQVYHRTYSMCSFKIPSTVTLPYELSIPYINQYSLNITIKKADKEHATKSGKPAISSKHQIRAQ